MSFTRRVLVAIAFFTLAAACASGAEEEGGASHARPSAEIGGTCGGVAGVQCADENAFCRLEPGACMSVADAAGVCAVKPRICTMEYAPVCGCDSKTYSNACAAAGAGASVAYQGECKDAG